MRSQLIWLCLLLAFCVTSEDESQSEESSDEDNTSLGSKELADLDVEVISGNKKGSQWLVIEKEYICIRHDK